MTFVDGIDEERELRVDCEALRNASPLYFADLPWTAADGLKIFLVRWSFATKEGAESEIH